MAFMSTKQVNNDLTIGQAPILPGQWLGMLGGGQLGRMFVHAAQAMGYRVAVLDPAADCPAAQAADRHIRAAYDDVAALDELAAQCAAVTTEFENVPADSLRRLALRARVAPAGDAVAVVQDRIAEKDFLAGQGIAVAPYAAIRAAADLDAASDALFPGILKAARLGYDGKGQARVANRAEALAAFESWGGVACVLEALQPLHHEISVVLARGADGATAVFPIARNAHEQGILAVTTVGMAEDTALVAQAQDAARRVADGLAFQGVLCVEFFVLQDGRLLANEVAPRPHNSGHFTQNACFSSQFEQQARAVAGMPLGNPQAHSPAIMLNLLGDIWFRQDAEQANEPDWAAVLAFPSAHLHLYGKHEARPGRKMGHINVVAATLEQARADAQAIASLLGITQP